MSREADTHAETVVDLTDAATRTESAPPPVREAADPVAPVEAPSAPASPAARPLLDDLVHPHDAERLVGLILDASHRRQDTFVRVRHPQEGWIEIRCSFVPVDASEPGEH